MEHCDRPWWKRPPVWFIAIAAVLLLIGIGYEVETAGKAAPTPYSAFLDQLEAGSVASVTFQGTEIRGRLKHPPGSAQGDAFSTRVPDVGDPALIPELRKQHVAIEVSAPSPWTSVLARIPWPMLVFLGVVLVAGFVRLVRGGKARPGPAASMPAHGMMGLVSGLFAKPDQATSPRTQDGDEPKRR
jgi:ATP-dependent Zn protease